MQSTVAGLGQSYLSTVPAAYVVTSNLQSTVTGLGSSGYVSSIQLQSTVAGLGQTYFSTAALNPIVQSTVAGLGQSYLSTVPAAYVVTSNLQSTVIGLGSSGYVSSIQLVSTVEGLGSSGFVSSLSLQSTVAGLGQTYVSTIPATYVVTSNLQSTVTGLGSSGFVSSLSLQSTVAGLGQTYVSTIPVTYVVTSNLQSTVTGLGSSGYVSSIQLQSTVTGLGSSGYVSTTLNATQISSLTVSTLALSTFSLFTQGSNSIVITNSNSNLGNFVVSSMNLGINTTQPLYPLDVNGVANFSSISLGAGNISLLARGPSLAIGYQVGTYGLGSNTLALGYQAGFSNQGLAGTAVGMTAGAYSQGIYGVALGNAAGYSNQGLYGTAIGYQAGFVNQCNYAVGLGYQAGYSNQGSNAVAIGNTAGYVNQSTNSIAIGWQAGAGTTATSSIILNASGAALNTSTPGLFVSPVRFATGGSNIVSFNTVSSELYYSDTARLSTLTTSSMGVGTTTQLSILHVAKDVAYSNITSNTEPATYAQVQISQGNSSGTRLYLGSAFTLGTGVASVVQSSDYYSSADHGGNLLLNPFGGSVGVNCNVPTRALDVNGSINFSGALYSNGTLFTGGGGTPAGINSAGNIGINSASNASNALFVSGTQSNTGNLFIGGTTFLVASSNTGTLGVAGVTTLSNTSNTGTLGVAGVTTLSNTSNAGTLGVAGLTTLTNSSNTGTLGVAGVTTLSNTSNTGTLGVRGITTLSSNVGIFNGSPSAQLDILGGHISLGTGGSNMMAFQFNTGGYRHFITTRHDALASSTGNAIDFWLNNVITSGGSSTAGTGNLRMMSVTAAGLGINCNAPSKTLDVNGSVNVGPTTLAGSNTLFVSKDIAFSNITTNQNPFNYAQVAIGGNTTSARLYLGAAYTGSVGSGSIIQASDYFSSTDNGVALFLNPKGGSISICSSNYPLAQLDVQGGHTSGGTGGSNLIAFQYYEGGFRHFITSRHIGSTSNTGNAIDFWINNSVTGAGSSTAGTSNVRSMSVTAAGVGINTATPGYQLDVNGVIQGAVYYSTITVGGIATVTPNNFGIFYNITTSGTYTLAFSASQASSNIGKYVVFRNNSGVTLSLALTGVSGITSPVTLSNAQSATIMVATTTTYALF